MFAESIRKRTKGIREKVFIGLSSGYDSGSIACELRRQGIPYKAYSITGSENMPVLSGRHALIGDESEYELFTIDEYGPGRQSLTKYLIDNVEPFKNTIHSSSSDYNEYGMDIKDDHGAGSLVAGPFVNFDKAHTPNQFIPNNFLFFLCSVPNFYQMII